MKNTLHILFILPLISLSAQHAIIPVPVQYETTGTVFTLDSRVSLDIRSDNPEVRKYAAQFQEFLDRAGIRLKLQTADAENPQHRAIVIKLLPSRQAGLGAEGYDLEVKERIIELSASEPGGIFNGLQTLRQLLPATIENAAIPSAAPVEIAGCQIRDYPRFGWRGLMLDVSRHFFTIEEVKGYLDLMAQYKFNVFHWHLTDDEGWRIEIKSLPKLTEVGAWRVERHGRFGENRSYPVPGEKASYGGFYTQEDIRDIVRYAADRNITIVPEIDMPGHSMAALAAYPELSTLKQSKFVNPGSKFAEWYGSGKFEMLIENTLNPADEKVYDFVDKVFTEIAALFPGSYIHMGGDECYHGYWEKDPVVQEFMKKNNLKSSHELQSYFVNRVDKIISSKGKKMIGWDEILEGGLTEGAAVMSWRGMEGGIEAAKLGHEVVMSPTTFAYLDYTQGDHSVENPIYADLSLEKTYTFEPVPEGVDPRFILGGQGNLWTEVIPTIQYAYYMTYPRAFALAEIFWSTKESRDRDDFIRRTEKHFHRFAAAGRNISKAVLDPTISVYPNDQGTLMCELKNSVPGTDIYYTIDNTYPVEFGHKYQVPFAIPEGDLSLRTRTFRNGQPLGSQLQIHRTDLEKRAGR